MKSIPTDEKYFRIVLLTPIQFNEKVGNLKEKTTIRTNEILDDTKVFSPNEWSRLDGVKNIYKDLDNTHFSIYDSINNERNLDLFYYNRFFTKSHRNIMNTDLYYGAHLLADELCNFFIIFDLTFNTSRVNNINLFIDKLLQNKDVLSNCGLENFWHTYCSNAKQIMISTLKKLKIKVNSENVLLITKDSSYPILFIKNHHIKEPESIFSNEENLSQRTNPSELCKDYRDAYIHLGWNYSLLINLPKNINAKFLAMMLVLQFHYYQIRFYKKYFQQKIQGIASLYEFTENELNNFDKLKIAYYKQYLDYKTFRSGLYPKIYIEFKKVELLWHIPEDINFVDKILDVQNDYITKKFQQTTETYNATLNKGLTLIALIQIATIYGIFKDALELKKIFPNSYNFASWLTFASLIFTGILLIYPWIKRKFKRLLAHFS